jgi:hypothetical protein
MGNREDLQNKIKNIMDKYSEALNVIDKFYRDSAKGKVSEKDYPHDYSKIALDNQIEIFKLIDQLNKLDENE